MKNFFTLLFFCCLFSNCSNDDQATMTTPSTTASLASRPEANSAFDNSYKGIYKGIVIGNVSGAVYVNVFNDDKIWAKLQTENHETYILQNVPLTVEEDSKDIVPFYIKYRFANENVSFVIKLDETGSILNVSDFKFFSDTHSKVCMVKEKSTSLIKCYTGTFTSHDESGNINFTSDGQLKVKGVSTEINSMNFTNIIGTMNLISPADEISKTGNDDSIKQYVLNANLHLGQISGYLSGYTFDGVWMFEDNEIGTWKAARIL